MTTAAVFAERLRKAGYRMTRQRAAVLRAVADSGTTLSALQLCDKARQTCPDLGLATVYRTLDVLNAVGGVERLSCRLGSWLRFLSPGGPPPRGLRGMRAGGGVQPLQCGHTHPRGEPGNRFPGGIAPAGAGWDVPHLPGQGTGGVSRIAGRGWRPVLLVALLLLVVAVAGGCGGGQEGAGQDTGAEGSPVLAVESFLADIAQNVAGDRLKVDVLLAPGVDPHSFQPSPADAKRVSAAQVLIVNGAGFEAFL